MIYNFAKAFAQENGFEFFCLNKHKERKLARQLKRKNFIFKNFSHNFLFCVLYFFHFLCLFSNKQENILRNEVLKDNKNKTTLN